MSSQLFAGALAVAAIICMTGGLRAQTRIPPPPQDFMMSASQSDAYEVDAGRTAAVQSRDERVRAFAQEMILDHSRTSEELRQAAMTSGLPLTEPGLSSDQAKLLSSLQSLRGQEFDRAYARQQTLAHAQAVAVAESFAAAGLDPNLRKAATSALPMIRDHLKKARELEEKLSR